MKPKPSYIVTLVDYDEDLFDITPEVIQAMQQTLAEAGATLRIDQRRTEAAVIDMARDADLVMIQSLRPLLTAAVIESLPRCRAIIRLGLGYDSVDVAAATRRGIPVSNVVGWCTDEVAEHAIALLFACVRRLIELDDSLRQGTWSRMAIGAASRIQGKTLGLIGFGRVARAVAGKLSGFGLEMLAYSRSASPEEIRSAGVTLVSLEKLLRQSDFISIHSALTPERHHLIGARELSQVRPGAILINTSRGPLVDEAALVAALASGRLGAAGLDVFEVEPLPATSPLLSLDNVILTPHVASYSREAVATLYRNGAQTAADLLKGKWVGTIINPEVRARPKERGRD